MKKLILPIFAIFAVNAHANVDPLSESKIGIGYQSISGDEMGVDLSLTGFTVEAGYQFENDFYIKGAYASLSDDTNIMGVTIDTELDGYYAGVGKQFNLDKISVVYAELGMLSAEATAKDGNISVTADDDEAYAAVGYKINLAQSTVLEVELNYAASTVSGMVGAQYNLTEQFAINAEVETDGDITDVIVGVSYFF